MDGENGLYFSQEETYVQIDFMTAILEFSCVWKPGAMGTVSSTYTNIC